MDPGSGGDTPIIKASSKGHVEVLRLLLCDPRVDPPIVENIAIRIASENGYADIVELLLLD